MKRLFSFTMLLLCLALAGNRAQAQSRELSSHSSSSQTNDNYTQGVGWIHTHILTNWYLQLQAGPQLYYGYQDLQGKFGDRLTWNFAGYLGRWVFPMIGVRVGAGYANYAGFISKDSWNQYMPWVGFGDCDINRENPATWLGGYYKYDDENYPNHYRQNWSAFYVTPDIMFNLSYANFYNPKTRFTTYAYAGVGFSWAQNEDCYAEDGTVAVPQENDGNTAANFHVGVIENMRLGKNWSISADLRFSLYEGRFDREEVPAVENGLRVEDYALNLNLGVTYNFNLIGKKKYSQWYKEHINHNYTEGDVIPEHLYTTHNVDINITYYVDTIFLNDTISEFDPAYERMIDSLAKILGKVPLDSLRDAFNANSNNVNLGDILGGQLVPYEMVFFELDKWDILTSENLKIAKMAYIMKQFPDQKFLLFGSADSKTGTVKRNEFLSVNRADVVFNKLIYEYEIPEAQLQRVYLGGILDYEPFELNRATCIIMDHPKVMEEFMKLKSEGQAGGSEVKIK